MNNNIKSIDTFSFLDLIDVDMDSTKKRRPFWDTRCGALAVCQVVILKLVALIDFGLEWYADP